MFETLAIKLNERVDSIKVYIKFMNSGTQIQPTPLHATSWQLFEESNLTMNRIQEKDKQSQSEHGMELWKYLPEFCLLRFKKNLKLQVQPAGKYYLVAAILINCRTCLYRSKRSSCFELEPPTLTTYMSNR